MTEDLSYELLFDENHPLSSTLNDTFSNNNFNKYERYVEKIRTLFVPSLEPRIYSCLETFVYRRDSRAYSDSPYLRRCLDVAATWRDPVESFCTKWRDYGFLEKMLTNAIKFLINDGLIDCLLNSIILNNRLNKVCRDLDELGIEKDFLRYLAVWNYINEKDYWLEDNENISTPDPEFSYDSIDPHSDLRVEIGSVLGDRRNHRGLKRVFKRRATEDSPEDLNKNNNEVYTNGKIVAPFPSRLSIDSSNPEGCRSSNAKKKVRSYQARYCRPSTCPSYRMKNPASQEWEGKSLKLQVCKASLEILACENESATSFGLSMLPLPCKFDDLIAGIVKNEPSSIDSIFHCRRNKLRAAVTKICHRINEILAKIDRKEVRRCRLRCEILPGCVSFKLMEQKANGGKACLFNDRVTVDQNDAPRKMIEESSSMRKFVDQRNSKDASLEVFKNSAFSPADGESQIVQNIEEEEATTKPFEILLRLSDVELQASDRKNVEELLQKESSSNSITNKIDHPICICDTSINDTVDDAVQNNPEDSNNPQDCSEGFPNHSNNDDIAIDKRDHHNSAAQTVDGLSTKNEEINVATSQNTLQQKEFSNRFGQHCGNDQICGCTASIDDLSDHREAIPNVQPFVNKTSSFFNSTMISDTAEKISNSKHDETAKKDRTSSIEKYKSDAIINGSSDKSICACPSDCSCPNKCANEDEPENCDPQCSCDTCDQPERLAPLKKSELIQTSSPLELANRESSHSRFRYLSKPSANLGKITSDRELYPNESTDEIKHEKCDSQCMSDTEVLRGGSSSLKKTEIIRMSSLLSPSDPEKLHPVVRYSKPTVTPRTKNVSSNGNSRRNCLEAQPNDSQNIDFHKEPSMISGISLESNLTKVISFIEAETKKPLLVLRPQIRPSSSAINKSAKKQSPEEHPILSARLSRPKGQRINISIEVCPDSEPSREHIPQSCKNGTKATLNNEFKGRRDVSLLRKPRGDSVEPQVFEKQFLLHPEKNTNDEYFEHSRVVEASVHSPPRPLESREYLPSFEPPSSMRNPIVYGMSGKSGVRSVNRFDRRSMNQDTRQRGGKGNYIKESGNSIENRCRSIEPKKRLNERLEKPDVFPRLSKNPEPFTPFTMQNNVCPAFSTSSVERMKHLIKTKLRRILLERDKATNTPKTTLTNRKYRLTMPNGKSDRSPFRQQRCRTIWESRSAFDSAQTSRSFGCNGRPSSARINERKEVKRLFFYNGASKDKSANYSRSFKKQCRTYDKLDRGEHSEDSKESLTPPRKSAKDRRGAEHDEMPDLYLNTDFQRLAGGSDSLYCKTLCVEDDARKKPYKSIYDHENEIIDRPIHNCNEDSKENVNPGKRKQKNLNDEVLESSGRLDWFGNSTSRHIYLYEFDRLDSSNDDVESLDSDHNRKSPSKIFSPPMSKVSRKERGFNMKKLSNQHCRNSRFDREESVVRNIPDFSSKIKATNKNAIRQGAFGSLDHDLRTKLSQYMNLCRNVKYSLLKRLRPDDIYEVSRTSIPCCDRYKFGDS